MLAWIKKILGLQSAVEKRRDNPVLKAAIAKSADVYERTTLPSLLDSAAIDALSRWVYLETNGVCNAPEPLEACRLKMAETMLRYALYQVLMIPAAPAEDDSGLRDLPGITGELSGHLRKLAMRNVDLVADTHENEFYSEGADLQRVAEIQFWRYFWLLHTLDEARKRMGDYYEGTDWFEAFRHAACAAQENRYRIDLDLPSAFSDQLQSRAPTAYSIFTDIVVSGAADPVAEWCDYHRGQGIPEPGLPPSDGTKLSLTASSSQ